MSILDVRNENFIGGRWRPAASGAIDEIVDPATGAVICTAPASGADDVDLAVTSAAEAFRTWGRTTPLERATALFRLADVIEANAEALIAVESLNGGKPIS